MIIVIVIYRLIRSQIAELEDKLVIDPIKVPDPFHQRFHLQLNLSIVLNLNLQLRHYGR